MSSSLKVRDTFIEFLYCHSCYYVIMLFSKGHPQLQKQLIKPQRIKLVGGMLDNKAEIRMLTLTC